MRRNCPICESPDRTIAFETTYLVPTGWPLPSKISWFTCDQCWMLYGDGDFDQTTLNDYYQHYYGYGVNSPDNKLRLQADAQMIYHSLTSRVAVVMDFGGDGDDGKSVLVEQLRKLGCENAYCVGAGEDVPMPCDVIYASHVLEHVYDLPQTMSMLVQWLEPNGTFIVDVPDSTGLVLQWPMPMLDFNTKHINHFTLRNLLDLGHRYGLEAVRVKPYILDGGPSNGAPCVQVHFKRMDMANSSAVHVVEGVKAMLDKLRAIDYPVNIWGMGDITWHLLSQIDLDVLDYIDNDPAYRGKTYKGKPVLEAPTNDAPIVILAQGQRQRLIAHIKSVCSNQIVEI